MKMQGHMVGARAGEGMENWCLMGRGVVWKDGRILEMDGDDFTER